MNAVIAVIVLIGFVQANISQKNVLKAEFQSFKLLQNKSYNSREDIERLRTFIDNKKLIDDHNKRYAAGEESYEMGVNQFTDMLPAEFQKLMLSSISSDTSDTLRADIELDPYIPESFSIPSSIDWREKGAVTEVKNQGSCGSCWAFSAADALESHHYIKTKQLISLSKQNLVDCTNGSPYWNRGCVGGWPVWALRYVRDNGGIDTEISYPYEGKDGSCRYNKNHIGATVSGIVMLPAGDETALANAVAIKGPISVCIDASSFQHYKGGVLNQATCTGRVNHCVVVVGYGHDSVGGDYWQVKNSWAKTWGENGYIRMSRNRNNQCKIADHAIYPLV